MANTEHKDYHDEEYDPCCEFETYIGSTSDFDEDWMEDTMKNVYKILSAGSVTGDTVIDLSCGLFTFHLLVAADYFKNIVLLESSDCSIEAIEKWIKKEPDAVDKSHMAMYACALKGKSTGWKEQEDKLRNAIKQIAKWDISQENPLGSVTLPRADCLISFVYLEGVCKDEDMFLKLLKQFASLLKKGGHLIIFVAINMSYYTIGQHKFFSLKCNEEFVRKALTAIGFVIKSTDKIPRKSDSSLIDYEYIASFVARKEREM